MVLGLSFAVGSSWDSFFFFGNLARSLGGRYWSWDFVWLILWFEFGDFIVARIVFVHLLMTE